MIVAVIFPCRVLHSRSKPSSSSWPYRRLRLARSARALSNIAGDTMEGKAESLVTQSMASLCWRGRDSLPERLLNTNRPVYLTFVRIELTIDLVQGRPNSL